MSKVSQNRTAWLSLDHAALPVKDAMRLVRDNLRRGNRMVRDTSHRSFPPIPQMVALAADGMLEIAESVVRGIAPGAKPGARLKAFPLPVEAYFGGDGSDMASRRRLFVATHYAVAKHLLRETPLLSEMLDEAAREALFVCETAIDSAWHRLQPMRARRDDDEIAQVAALTLALLHHRPIRKAPLATSGTAWDHDPNLIVFATAGLATAAIAFARPGAPLGHELLGLASDVVRARIGSFEAAGAAPDPHRELQRLYREFAPILS